MEIIDYVPFLTAPDPAAPVSPPMDVAKGGLTVNGATATVQLNWSANPETDIAGYRIWYDTDAGYPYANSIDAGNFTSASLPGLSLGTLYHVAVTAYDANKDGTDDWFDGNESWFSEELTVEAVNHAPVWVAKADTTAPEKTRVRFTVRATDEDGQTLAYSATGLPSGATFDPATRTFDWMPTYAQAGAYDVTFTVSDGVASANDIVKITVTNRNAPPVWVFRADTSIGEGTTLAFAVSASDVDAQTLTYSAPTLPAGATFTPTTRAFAWTPGYRQAGAYDAVFSVTDGIDAVNDTVRITVTNVNGPPAWAARPDTAVSEGVALAFVVTADDPDDEHVHFEGLKLPNGASFDTTAHTFAWTPDFLWVLHYSTTRDTVAIFTAYDGQHTVRDTVKITVRNVNRSPIWAGISDKAGAEGTLLTFVLNAATDPDGQTVTYTAPEIPAGATFVPGTRAFNWTPSYRQSGTHRAIFSASDGALMVRDTVSITVANTNLVPQILTVALPDAKERKPYTAAIVATDIGDALTLTLEAGPAWLSLAQTGDTTGALSGRPGRTDFSPTVTITVKATGPFGLFATKTWTITVADTNWAPRFVVAPPASAAAREDSVATFTFSVVDPDADSLRATVSPDSGAVAWIGRADSVASFRWSWRPGFIAAGSHALSIVVRDVPPADLAYAAVGAPVTVNVADRNRSPIATIATGGKATPGRTVAFTYAASDPDGEAATVRAVTMPEGASFNAATGAFSWTRGAGQNDQQAVTFGISDGHGEVFDAFTVTASTANELPTVGWTTAPPDTISWDVPLAYTLADAEGDSVYVSADWSTTGASGTIAPYDGTYRTRPGPLTFVLPTGSLIPNRRIVSRATVRIIPANRFGTRRDGAPPFSREFTVLNLPCDWDRDGKIGLADFSTLRTAWVNRDTTRNIGPYAAISGESFPSVRVTQDRKIDFEDIMAWGMFWDWAAGKGRVKTAARIAARPASEPGDAPVTLVPTNNGTAISIGLAGRTAHVMALAIRLPARTIALARLERGPFVGSEGWWFARIDTVAGVIEVWLAPDGSGSGEISRLLLPPGWDGVSIGVGYEIIAAPGAASESGAFVRDVRSMPLPTAWAMSVAPNPFNPSTTIRFEVPAAERVRIAVYDVLGREVAVLVDEMKEPGRNEATWTGRDAAGRQVASGTYVVRLSAGQVRMTERVTLAR